MRGGPYTEREQVALLDYCQSDVDALPKLLDKMIGQIDVPRSLLRGRYMRAIATMEHTGVPIDVDILGGLRAQWPTIQSKLIERVDPRGEVFDGRTFKSDRWARYLVRHNIAWPKLPSGSLMLDDETWASTFSSTDGGIIETEFAAKRSVRIVGARGQNGFEIETATAVA